MQELNQKHYKAIFGILEGKRNIDVAEEVGVSERTIYRWLNDPLFKQTINDMIVNYDKGRMNKVLEATYREAREGSAAHAKLLFEAHGMIGGKQNNVEVNVNSDVDYNKLRERLKEKMEKNKEEKGGKPIGE